MKETEIENSDLVFDRVLHSVGDDGKFQRRYNLVFNFGISLAGTMVYLNLLMALTIPNHWCSVPGRENTNNSIDEWKTLTLPREKDSSGLDAYSSCKMFNKTNDHETDKNYYNETDITSCQFGYEYDKEWYSSTIPSTQNWVCDKELYVSNILASSKVGEVFGGLVFGYLGDVIGRRPVFIIALLLSVTCRCVSIMVTDYYTIFLILSVLTSLPSTTGPQACQVILMEISPMEDRASIAEFLNIGWTCGLCMLPLVYWIIKDWTYYIIVTTIPLALYIPLCFFLIESPRWLLSRGRVADCICQLSKIAKINGTKLSPDVSLTLHSINIKPEKTYGICSLFTSWRLAKNTILLVISWIATVLSYNTILLNTTNLSGNPFLNFFLQSLAELPSFTLGKIICEKFGRRFTCGIAYLLTILTIASVMFITNVPNLVWLQITLIVIAKFAISMAYFITSLQSLEIYPTCVRQTGFTFGLISANTLCILVPYIIYLGINFDIRFPYLLITFLTIIGLVSQILLPETLNEKLPETLQEARTFGADQGYWSIPYKNNDTYVMTKIKYADKDKNEHSDVEN